MKKIIPYLIVIVLPALVCAGSFSAALQDSAVRPGLCVVVGCESSDSLIRSQLAGKFIVQGLCLDKRKVAVIRKELVGKGVNGKVSVSFSDGQRLPYIDNLVNAVVIVNLGSIGRKEVMRVVAPYGVVIYKKNGVWKRSVKGFPKEMDEWAQAKYDASNSRVSKDRLVGPPTRLQWLAQEKYDREDLLQLLSAGGRNFYIFKSGMVVARDAFNGVRLWEQEGGGFPWVATDGYLCSNLRGRLATIDAATGEVKKTTVKIGGQTSSWDEGVLYTPNGAYDIAKEAFLWENPDADKGFEFAPIVAEGKVIYLTPRRKENSEIICRDAKTGKDLWRIPSDGGKPALCYRGKLLIEGKEKQETVMRRNKERKTDIAVNHCVNLADGKNIWTIEFYLPGHHGAATMFCVGDVVWVRPGKLGSGMGSDEFWRSYDLNTGKKMKEVPVSEQSMHRCFEPRATERFIIATGVDYLDHTTDKTYIFHAARGDCGLGATPANGMLYQFPNACMCMGQVDGVSGVSSHSLSDPAESALTFSDVLVKGPAYGKVRGASSDATASKDWLTLRANNARLGSNQAEVSDSLRVLWKIPYTMRPSSPVISGRSIYVALRDAHAIASFSAVDGKPQWTFTASGPIDSPPTLVGDAVVFGGEDGWVYVVQAVDGELVWKFKAAPNDRSILTDGHVASAWPLHGSLLVEKNMIYAPAGYHNELDGGIFTYALDLATGKKVWQKRLIREGVTQTIIDAEVGNTGNTILSSDGDLLYMEMLHMGLKTAEIKKTFRMGKSFFMGGWPSEVVWGGPHGFLVDASLPAFVSGHSSSDWIWGNVRANMLAVEGNLGYGIVTLKERQLRWQKKSPLFKSERLRIVYCAKQLEVRKAWHEYIAEESFVWVAPLPDNCVSKSVIKTANRVVVAGKISEGDSRTGLLFLLDPATGEERGRLKLSSPPLWDGLASAGRRLYLVTENNELVCIGQK